MTRVTKVNLKTGLLEAPESWTKNDDIEVPTARLENLEKKLGIERREFSKKKN